MDREMSGIGRSPDDTFCHTAGPQPDPRWDLRMFGGVLGPESNLPHHLCHARGPRRRSCSSASRPASVRSQRLVSAVFSFNPLVRLNLVVAHLSANDMLD
jgi:hypothetical protein